MTQDELELLKEIADMLKACGYGGSNRRTENTHISRLNKLIIQHIKE